MTSPAVFFRIAFLPVEVLGCRTRGLVALLIAFTSGMAALSGVLMSRKASLHGCVNNLWWLISPLILVIPVIAMIILA